MGIELISVACNHCGAPLQVQSETRFVTCTYCGAKLEVHRSGNSLYTSVLEAIERQAQQTQRMADDLDVIKRQNEIERLDREWIIRRDRLMTRDKHGHTSTPSAVGSIIGAIVMAVFGIIWTAVTSSTNAPFFFPLFGVVFIFIAVGTGINGALKASQYNDELRCYERQREALLQQREPE
jgi:uncharacterized Zn finger protein (UPF0148 family)